MQITVGQRLTCLRCGHGWNTRSERKPVQCPRCKSTRWDRQREERDSELRLRPRRSFGELEAFGMWADLTESDEELLDRLGVGLREPEDEQ
jgi:DNA-directed RNA polymerase subunit RPC12/RpoP